MRVRLIVFHQGRRIERRYEDHHDAIPVARKLRSKGVRVAIPTAKVISSREYPPGDLSERLEGKLWCPYCGAWRWFKVPRYKENGQFTSLTDDRAWLNSCYRQGIKICSWCYVSENEFSVRKANGTWSETSKRRRRKRRRRVAIRRR